MSKKPRKSTPKTKPAAKDAVVPVVPVVPAVPVPAAPAPAPKQAPAKPAPAKAPPAHADIARVAREIWEERRRPLGQDFEIWLEAERRLAK